MHIFEVSYISSFLALFPLMYLGDTHKSSTPKVSKCVTVQTGRRCVDQSVQELSSHGYTCTDVLHQGNYSTIIMAVIRKTQQCV